MWRVLNWVILAKQVLKFYWASYRGSLMYGFEKSKPVTHFTWWRPGHSTEATKAWFNGKRMYKVVTSKWNRLADVLEKRYLHKNVWKLVTICSGLRQITVQIWVQNDHFDEVQVRVSDWLKTLTSIVVPMWPSTTVSIAWYILYHSVASWSSKQTISTLIPVITISQHTWKSHFTAGIFRKNLHGIVG